MTVTFWFDPACPFTWRTSRWLRDTAARRGETVRWRFLSLAVINEDKEIPEQYREGMAWSRRVHRVLAAADQQHGQQAVDRLYTAIGQRVHDRGERDEATLAAALAEAGLPAELIEAADDAAMDKVVRVSHDEAQARVGTETGSPVMALGDGPAFFGPVVVPIPEAEDADRLFEALRLLSAVPQFSELKRARKPF
ncbi:MAG TPA: DsbA family protein [Pilimelia sp.]|nr:DsbA family protein [Pilimelia sp.]